MERLSVLIHKLKEQFEENVPPSQMLGTVRQIESELTQLSAAKQSNGYGTSKVAVMMPSMPSAAREINREPAREEKREDRHYQPTPVEAAPAWQPAKKQEEPAFAYDPLHEIPTLSHQQSVMREINDVIGVGGTSMNDSLRQETIEVAHVLTEAPIRDLKKAIGVNDRYVFLNELFRGDETMYERSLKTLNGFRIYQEAEYWINRELKIKLGWNEGNPIVRHFYQLVRRRFA